MKIDNIFLSKGKLPLANNMKVKRFIIKKALEEMEEKGGKRVFLNNLSDYVAYWPSGGKEKYMKDVMEKREKYGLNTLLSGENDKVEDVYKEVKSQIDNL